MQYLKADTAATILIGPFVAPADGVTPVTDITLAAADHAELMKHDGTTFVDLTSDSRTFTHKEGGFYTLALGTGDTDTEGRLTVLIMDTSACLPVWKDFMVVNANVYDSLFAAATTDYLQVDTIQVTGTAQTANDNGADINAILVDTGTTLDGKLDTIDGIVDDILVDTGTTLDGLITTVDTVVDGIQTDLSNATDGLGALKALIDGVETKVDTVDGVADGIQTDLSNATDGLGALKALIDTVDGVVDSILTDTAEIGTAGAGLSDLGGMSTTMKGQVESEASDALIALNLDHLMKTAVADRDVMAEVVDGTVLANIMTKTDGDTSDFDPDTDSLEAIRDNQAGADAAAIADAVCDEALSGHTTAGTVGKALSDAEEGRVIKL